MVYGSSLSPPRRSLAKRGVPHTSIVVLLSPPYRSILRSKTVNILPPLMGESRIYSDLRESGLPGFPPHRSDPISTAFNPSLLFLLIFISGLILLSPYPASSQIEREWRWQNPFPQGDDLYSVWAFDENHVIATGYTGYRRIFLETYDAGANWNVQYYEDVHEILSWQFFDDKLGYAVGDPFPRWGNYMLQKTTDGGKSWNVLYEPDDPEKQVKASFFIDPKIGWIQTGDFLLSEYSSFYKTIDGGLNWEMCLDSISYASYKGPFFLDETHGWILRRHRELYITTDGGNSWNNTIINYPLSADMVYFITDSIGWVIGSPGVIAKTIDGGYNWTGQQFGNINLISITFVNDDTGFVASDRGHILRTTDSGEHWELFRDNTNNGYSLIKLHFSDPYHGWGVGSMGNMIKTADCGESWTLTWRFERINGFYDFFYLDNLHGWRIGNSYYTGKTISYTSNGGWSWDAQFYEPPGGVDFKDIYFLDDQKGWVTASNGRIYQTDNGGETWELTENNFTDNDRLGQIYFANADTGFVIVNQQDFYSSHDGGRSWHVIPEFHTEELRACIHYIDNKTAWLYNHRDAWRTIDGGISWQQFSWDIPFIFVAFYDSLLGVATGGDFYIENYCYLYKTLDGGRNWEKLPIGPLHVPVIDFIDRDRICILASWGYTAYSENGGETWNSSLHGDFPSHFHSVYHLEFVTPDFGWATGFGWDGWDTRLIGFVWVYSDQPPKNNVSNNNYYNKLSNNNLLYNYHNPFNSTTTVVYETIHQQFIEISIYNILGRKITDLHRSFVQAGIHYFNWNGTNSSGQTVSSGTYFIKLSSDEMMLNKKITIIR